MPRERDPKREEAKRLWLENGGRLDPSTIAAELSVSPGTVRGWKSKDQWERNGATAKRNEAKRSKSAERSESLPVEFDGDDYLTAKQMLFVLEYLRDYNATRAAIAVGYSKKAASSIGWELLRKPQVQSEIKRQKEMLAVELGLDVRRVVAELMKIAFADISDISDFGQRDEPLLDGEGKVIMNPHTGQPFTQKVNFMALKNADEIDTSVISEVKQGRGGVIAVKLHDKMRALERLERYLDYLTDEEKLRMDKMRADIKAAEARSF